MIKEVASKINSVAGSAFFWLLLLAVSVGALLLALYHQYVLEDLPCVVCIQIRLWFSLLAIIAIAGFFLRKSYHFRQAGNLLLIVVAGGLTERSYLLLGTERGFIFSDCGFDLGLPQWFDIENWLPMLYRIETSCGYTPEVAFGITMAESLMVASVVFLAGAIIVFLAGFFRSDSE